MYFSSTAPRDGKSDAGTTRRRSSLKWSSLKRSSWLLVFFALMLTGAPIHLALAQAQVQPTSPPSPAPAASGEPIGNVATLTGTASVTRSNQNAIPLKLKDDIYLNDVLQTSVNSTLGVTFNDETTFNLTANASITVDDYIYEDGGKKNSALFDVTEGTVAFVASAVARTGDMKITTPTATLGIRGTTGLVEVNGAGAHPLFAALKDAVGQGVVVVQSTRAGSGRTFRGKRLQEAGILIADNLNPQKARLLLALALTTTREPAEIERIFRTY